jgi:hypothetical protein
MAPYRPPKREMIEEHLTVAKARVAMPDGAWDGISESFVRSLIKAKLLPRMVPHTKAKGRGRGARMKPSGYRDFLRIVRLRALDVPRREWAFFLWLRGSEFPESRVRASVVASFRQLAKNLQSKVAPTGRYGLPAQVKAQRALQRDPEADPVLSPFIAAAFSMMADPNAPVDVDSLWNGVPAAMRRLGVDDQTAAALMGLRTGETSEEVAFAHMGTIFRDITGMDPNAPAIAEGINELASTVRSGRLRSFLVDKHDRSRLLERLLNAPWPAYERARAIVAATMQHIFDRIDVEAAPEEIQGLLRTAAITQSATEEYMRWNPWVVVLNFAIYVEDGAPKTDIHPTRFT